MSTYNDIDITCEKCGDEFRGTVWTAVHAGQDPELRDLLMGGELNMVMCPSCSHVSYQDYFVLYQDPAAELVAYVYPPAQENESDALRKMMLKGFADAQEVYDPKVRKTYEPLLMFGLTSLVELLRAEEEREEQAEIAEAICKEKKIPLRRISRSKARKLKLPSVLPEGEKGVSQLLSINPALTVYEDFRRRLSAGEVSDLN